MDNFWKMIKLKMIKDDEWNDISTNFNCQFHQQQAHG